MTGTETRHAPAVRLFFALWPEAQLQTQFHREGQKLFRLCGGHRTRRENIHMTLAFLGDVDPAHLERVKAIAAAIELPAFHLLFTRLGWWRSNQVAWAATEDTPRPLADLVRALQLGLAREGFKFDERRFFPHVTLLRKAHCSRSIIQSHPILWIVNDFALVRSTLREDGAHYAIMQRWRLRGAPG